MAATPISGGTITTTDTTSPVPFSIDVGAAAANRLLLIAANGKDNESVSGITIGGSAMTRIDGATLSGSLRLYAYAVPSDASGPQAGEATLSDSFGTGLISWGLFGDTDPAGRYGTSWNASGTGTTQTSGSQTCPSGAVLFGALWHQGGEAAATITSGTAFGNGYDGANGRAFSSAYRSDTGALAWTAGYGLPWSIVGVAVLGVAAGPILSGAATLDDSTASGGLTSAAPSTLGGAATLEDVAASGGITSAPVVGTFTSESLRWNNDTVEANVALTWLSFRNITTGTVVLDKTGISTNSLGVFSVADALLVPGTAVRADWKTATGHHGWGIATPV